MTLNKRHVVASMQGDEQTAGGGWDSVLGRVERGCPPDKVMLGQRPEWGKRDDVWISGGRVPSSYDPGDQSMADTFKEQQRGPGGQGSVSAGKRGSWGERREGTSSRQGWEMTRTLLILCLRQGQPLRSPEQRRNMGPLMSEKIKSGYSEENRLRGGGG